VKNPLHALKGTAEIVDPLIPKDAEERRMWELHVGEIQRLQRVADRFLSFARPAPPVRVPIDLRDVVRRVVALVGADARQKGVTFEDGLLDVPVTVEGDRDQLAQVVMNVAVNAVQALTRGGQERGRVRFAVEGAAIEGRPTEGRAMHVVRIENDGPPIPDDDLEHLFDPFHGSSDEGSGLGLSIASRIADQHDGWIEAANAGLGVTFTLYLPAA
jgi:signal transduction histidine kinase